MESLYLATRFNAAKFAGALVEACDRVIHDAPGTEAAAHADTYKILYRYFGEWSDEADARTALHEFAEKYPNNKLGADLFIAYAQRQDRAGAKATLTEARAMYADGAAAQKIDEKLAAIGIYEAADAQTKKTDPAKRSRPQKPTTTTKPETKPRKPLYSSGGRRITFSAPTLEGKTVTTGQFQGKVVLIDFWATWCGPCVREIPNVKAVYDKYHRHGLEVIGVSLDNDPEKLRAFLDQNRLSWPQVFFQGTKERGWNNPIAKKYGIQSIPTMFLLDRSGHLVTTDLRGHGALERAVEEQLFGATTASR
jgi:thiol-disulfide isomerase/thioredoxin